MQYTSYGMRIGDWSSDVCSSYLIGQQRRQIVRRTLLGFDFGGRIGQPVLNALRLQGVERQRRGDVAPSRAPLVAVQAVAQRLQFGAELPVHIGGEARPRGIIMSGGAVKRDPAPLRRLLCAEIGTTHG